MSEFSSCIDISHSHWKITNESLHKFQIGGWFHIMCLHIDILHRLSQENIIIAPRLRESTICQFIILSVFNRVRVFDSRYRPTCSFQGFGN